MEPKPKYQIVFPTQLPDDVGQGLCSDTRASFNQQPVQNPDSEC